MSHTNLGLLSVGAFAALFAACSSGNKASPPSGPGSDGGIPMTMPDASTPDDASSADAPMTFPFQADPPSVYVRKVKNVLLGLAPTDDEVKQVTADPSALKTLIQGWMKEPQYEQKMMRFFELAFQQTQISYIDFADQAYPRQIAVNSTTVPQLVQNAQESFARTMLKLIADGQPMTDAVTTPKLMMTTAMKELYAFLDVWQVDDAGKVTDRFRQANPGVMLTIGAAAGPVPIEQSVDPQSPNFMHWYNPDVVTEDMAIAGCQADPIVIPGTGIALHWLLYGSIENRKGTGGVVCPQSGGSAMAPQLTTDDFNDWSLVTIRAPNPGEAVSAFYDLAALRKATELVLEIPRVGFYSTPAFFANWQTNISNQMRVTLNQTLVVALGSSVDGTDTTTTPGNPPPGLDTDHAGSGACAYCHQTLDPLRSIFSSSYSWNYHNQAEAAFADQKGMFSFRGVTRPVSNLNDFGVALAEHPLFAEAWTQKLCYYVNSAPCSSTDPELQRIVAAFKASSYSWNTLVLELLASPLTTNASKTETAETNGTVVAVSRRDHLCAALDNRLGFSDVCRLDVLSKKPITTLIPSIVGGLPSDGYGRGSAIPVLPNDPTLFYRAATENICAAIAAQIVDVPVAKQVEGVKQWSSAAPDAAIADFVAIVMALPPSDPKSAPATAILRSHFDAARAGGASAADSLKSTFVVACSAPSAVSVGL